MSARARRTPAAPDPALVARFAADLDRLHPAGRKLGLAVSGGPDSLALLLLASAARPGEVEAATVNHGLRTESAAEAEFVAGLCRSLGVPHATLTIEWAEEPATALQERARAERYRQLSNWADERAISAVATGHHLDDQAETLLMRLVRGAGVQGLAGMRAVAPIPVPGSGVRLVRPLLGWRRSELEQICAAAGAQSISDPSNDDDQFERVRIRKAVADADWLDPVGLARSAGNLAAADAALRWAAEQEWQSRTRASNGGIDYRPQAPLEIRRRVVARAIATLSSEGQGAILRGREIDQVVATLLNGGKGTLRGVLYEGGDEWRFSAAPPRKANRS